MNCTAFDIQNEQEFKARFETRSPDLVLRKLTDQQRLDFAVENRATGCVGGFIEFKRRKFGSQAFSTSYLNINKWIALAEVARTTGLPCLFAVGFDDCDMLYRYRPEDQFPVQFVERFNEAVVAIPMTSFARLDVLSSKRKGVA